MKKICSTGAAIGVALMMFSCSDQLPNNNNTISKEIRSTESYHFNGKMYMIKIDQNGNPVEDRNYHIIDSVLNCQNSGYMESDDGDLLYLYTDEDQLKKIIEIETGNSKNASVNKREKVAVLNRATASDNITTLLYLNTGFSGAKMEFEGNKKSLGEFNDHTSSLRCYSNSSKSVMIFYENTNYKGRSIAFRTSKLVNNRLGRYMVEVNRLSDYCMVKRLWWCHNVWNDKISSCQQQTEPLNING